MSTYTITNRTSGLLLGLYESETIEHAADELARDAGYRDADHMNDVTEDDWRDDLVIVEAAP